MIVRRSILKAAAGVALTGLCALASLGRASAPPPARFASRRINVTVKGAGRDVILIPGLASGPAVWNRVIAAVPGYRYHIVHVRGFAGLPADLNGDGPLLTPITDEIARYVRESGLNRPALVGHSMGGTLAMMLAARGIPAIDRVMVVDMLPDGAAMLGGTSAGVGYLAQQLNGYLTQTKQGRQMLADMVHNSPGGRDSDPRVISQSLAELAQNDLGPWLNRITCPLDIIYAVPADSRLRSAQAQRYHTAYARAPRARLIGIGPSGHVIMADQPQKFASALLAFLR